MKREEIYSFSWAGKREAEQVSSTPTEKRMKFIPEKSINAETTGNIFIEGDNLDALKLLLGEFTERVDVIYIDPPYNTGNDFVYHDKYAVSVDDYLSLTGQESVDLESNENPETDGRYHAAWLSMMYPRMILARRLLSSEGVICVSIDDNEVHHLRILMNLVFGENCFKNSIVIRRGAKSVQAQFDTVDALTVGHEYVLLYSKNPEKRFTKLQLPREEPKPGTWNNHWRGTNRPTMRYELFGIVPERGQWRWSKKRSDKAVENYQMMLEELGVSSEDITQEQIDNWYLDKTENGDEIDLLRLSSRGTPQHYVPPSDSILGNDLWDDIRSSGWHHLRKLFGKKVFDNPKPVELINRILSFTTDTSREYYVLDFFAGSCTTAESVLEMNIEDGGLRRFIMVQQNEPLKEPIELDDSAILHSIADVGTERIKRVMTLHTRNHHTNGLDLGFRYYKI
ncbi:MAG: hypothetical protein BAJATHORv1_10547 [Candidatus Thorarchaeota archaeon]|nr:MAG: hypothetical protein BAJATHORv1_10547 [Candidatus Thorarchaeota archaeon]